MKQSKAKPKLSLNRPPKGPPLPPQDSDGYPMLPPLASPKRPRGKKGR